MKTAARTLKNGRRGETGQMFPKKSLRLPFSVFFALKNSLRSLRLCVENPRAATKMAGGRRLGVDKEGWGRR